MINYVVKNRAYCVRENQPYFESAAMEYQIYCKPFYKSWSLGRVFMVALAHIAGEWRLASFLHGGLCIFNVLFLLFLLPESIIWLKRKGDTVRVERAQQRLDWINGSKSAEEEEVVQNTAAAKKVSLMDVIRDPNLRVGFFVLCVIIADGYLPWLGRRKVFIIGMSVCTIAAAGLVALLYLRYKGTMLYLVIYLTAYNSIALIWEPNFVCASELMPTEVRATTTAFLGILSRVSIITASFMVAFKTIHERVIMWTVLAANLINLSITAKLLKETKNCNLDDIRMEDRKKDSTSERSREQYPRLLE
ncbi:hypothetical protein ANCCEY_00169 [Ancylostoma ceylanicum]|uniref:Major facilitator superfamily (MFS) profile domain-containing protein n=1 Tax=Ancylostoma ceylanicum TaxID=53326 RepID=A0A0D6MAQ9_9BILA|nr:hypothetical protein ANCCEY_00169 [Ancylostoma ceylanicum]